MLLDCDRLRSVEMELLLYLLFHLQDLVWFEETTQRVEDTVHLILKLIYKSNFLVFNLFLYNVLADGAQSINKPFGCFDVVCDSRHLICNLLVQQKKLFIKSLNFGFKPREPLLILRSLNHTLLLLLNLLLISCLWIFDCIVVICKPLFKFIDFVLFFFKLLLLLVKELNLFFLLFVDRSFVFFGSLSVLLLLKLLEFLVKLFESALPLQRQL